MPDSQEQQSQTLTEPDLFPAQSAASRVGNVFLFLLPLIIIVVFVGFIAYKSRNKTPRV